MTIRIICSICKKEYSLIDIDKFLNHSTKAVRCKVCHHLLIPKRDPKWESKPYSFIKEKRQYV